MNKSCSQVVVYCCSHECIFLNTNHRCFIKVDIFYDNSSSWRCFLGLTDHLFSFINYYYTFYIIGWHMLRKARGISTLGHTSLFPIVSSTSFLCFLTYRSSLLAPRFHWEHLTKWDVLFYIYLGLIFWGPSWGSARPHALLVPPPGIVVMERVRAWSDSTLLCRRRTDGCAVPCSADSLASKTGTGAHGASW